MRLRAIFFIIGLALLAYVLIAFDFRAAGGALLRIGWWFPIALASTLVVQLLRTLAWRLVMKSYAGQVSFFSLYRVRLIGEAFNYLSVAGPFLGDPMKAWLVSSKTGLRETAVGVAFDRYLYSLSAGLYLAIVAAFWLPPSGVFIVLPIGTAIALSPLWVARYRPRLPLSRMFAVVGIHFCSHLFLSLEVAIFLKALGAGAALHQAFLVEAVTKGVNGLFFFLPLQVGVFEGAHVAALHYLQLGASLGLTLGIARRFRSLFWSAVGLAMLLQLRFQKGGNRVCCGYPGEQFSQ